MNKAVNRGAAPKNMRRWVVVRVFCVVLVLPVQGWVSSPFGLRHDPYTHRVAFHSGIDISSKYAEAVKAVRNGVISFAGKRAGYGNLVTVSHGDGLETYYGHLGRIFVASGESVVAGQALGWTGMTGRSTGPHVHFEVRKRGIPVSPSLLP